MLQYIINADLDGSLAGITDSDDVDLEVLIPRNVLEQNFDLTIRAMELHGIIDFHQLNLRLKCCAWWR